MPSVLPGNGSRAGRRELVLALRRDAAGVGQLRRENGGLDRRRALAPDLVDGDGDDEHEQHLAAIRRNGKVPVILYADLDGLKTINDSFGHHEGDRALKQTAELLKDTAIRPLPLLAGDAEAMIAELKMAPLLSGYRGRPRADLAALCAAIEAFAAMASRLGDRLAEAEINPLFVMTEGGGVKAADGLVVLRAPAV